MHSSVWPIAKWQELNNFALTHVAFTSFVIAAKIIGSKKALWKDLGELPSNWMNQMLVKTLEVEIWKTCRVKFAFLFLPLCYAYYTSHVRFTLCTVIKKTNARRNTNKKPKVEVLVTLGEGKKISGKQERHIEQDGSKFNEVNRGPANEVNTSCSAIHCWLLLKTISMN